MPPTTPPDASSDAPSTVPPSASLAGSPTVPTGAPNAGHRGALLRRIALLWAVFLLGAPAPARTAAEDGPVFRIGFEAATRAEPADGRLLLLIAPLDGDPREPRFRVDGRVTSAQVFGVDVEGLAPGGSATIDRSAFGFPIESLADLPPGEYTVQALLHLYETFDVAHGHRLKLPMDRGEGQRWNRAPGDLHSTPRTVRLDPTRTDAVELVLDRVIPPIEPPADTEYVRHIRIRSELLSEFWGRPMHLGAHVLLPAGADLTSWRS